VEKLIERLGADSPQDRAGALSDFLARWDAWTGEDLEKLGRARGTADVELGRRADEAFTRIRIRRELGSELVRRVPNLDGALFRGGPEDQVWALKQLGTEIRAGGVSPSSTKAVLARVGTPGLDENAFLELARTAIEQQLRELAPFFAPYLDDPRGTVRGAALRTLGWLDAQEFTPEIVARLPKDPAAMPALGFLGRGEYLNSILKRLRDPDPSVASSAVSALSLLGDRRAIPELLPLLADSEVQVRVLATAVLAELGDSREVAPVAALLRDADEAVRYVAVAALLVLPPEKDSWNIIRPMLEDSSERVRKIAGVYLAKSLPENEGEKRDRLAADIQALFPKPGVEAWAALIHLGAVPRRPLKKFLEWVLEQRSLTDVDHRMVVDALARTLEPKGYEKLNHPIEVSRPVESLDEVRALFRSMGLELEGSPSFGGRLNPGVCRSGESVLVKRFPGLFYLREDRVRVLPWEDCFREWIKRVDRHE
jgi:HEAT repeat protein